MTFYPFIIISVFLFSGTSIYWDKHRKKPESLMSKINGYQVIFFWSTLIATLLFLQASIIDTKIRLFYYFCSFCFMAFSLFSIIQHTKNILQTLNKSS